MPAGYFAPPAYFFSPPIAHDILNEFLCMDINELERIRLIMEQSSWQAEIRDKEEEYAVAQFGGYNVGADPYSLLRQQAQKTLLWRFALEKINLEIKNLEKDCLDAEKLISRIFSEENNESQSSDNVKCGAMLDEEWDNWHACVVSAMFFISSDMPVYMEGKMAKDVMDSELSAIFKPANSLPLKFCKIPLWRLLAKTRPYKTAYPYLDKIYNETRTWLINI